MAKIKNDITVDELVALLKKTSLPTIVVEGSDDIIVYRSLEERLQHLAVSILPAGGRPKILELYGRRAEFDGAAKVAYIADQDIWINVGVPLEYQDACLVLTTGYSVENDVIVDGELWKLLRGAEVNRFQSELDQFCEWYALALKRHLDDASNPITLHPDHVLDPTQRAGLLTLEPGENYPDDLRTALTADPHKLIRGKSLLGLLLRSLSYKGREPRHTSSALLEWVSTRPGSNLNRISANLEAIFA